MKASDFRITRLASGFWCVWFRGNWIDAAQPSEAAAKSLIRRIIKSKRNTL